jgi:hypothetical protein
MKSSFALVCVLAVLSASCSYYQRTACSNPADAPRWRGDLVEEGGEDPGRNKSRFPELSKMSIPEAVLTVTSTVVLGFAALVLQAMAQSNFHYR